MWTPNGALTYVVMRRNPTVVSGWNVMSTIDASVCDSRCSTTISWRVGMTEIGVFGIFNGEVKLIGYDFTYR